MKTIIVLFGVCLLVGAAISAEEDLTTSQKTKVDTEDSNLHAEESLRLEIQVHPQTPLETDRPSKVTEGQLSTAAAEQDASFHLDSRGGITNIQGAVPKDDLIETHEKLTDKFQDAIDKSHLTYSADNQYSMYTNAPFQWAYEVMAPSTGDYQSRVEHRQEDGVVRGRYSFIQPDGSLRVVNYIAHPEDGFQATVQNQPISSQHQYQAQQQQYNQVQRERSSNINSERFNTQINREQRQRQDYGIGQQFNEQQLQFKQRQQEFDQRQMQFDQRQQQINQNQQQFSTTRERTNINAPKQSFTKQYQQVWQQHPLYARLNTPRRLTHNTFPTQHQLTPSSKIIPSLFHPSQRRGGPAFSS